MPYRYLTADVFTDRRFGGNPLAVFPDARGLDGSRMQLIAGELNLSETVFMFPPEDPRHTRRLRIFTPGTELPFAGHPTIGAAHILAWTGEISLQGETTSVVFEEGVGPVPVSIRVADGRPVFAQLTAAQLPEFGPAPPPAGDVAAALSLAQSDLLESGIHTQAVSCGVPFLFVPLRDRSAVGRARLNRERWQAALADFWASMIFLFAYDAEPSGSRLHARMFAPSVSIPEDPATGSAAAALAGYLAVRDSARDGTLRWVVEQGVEMGRPSILHVEADKVGGEIRAARVGGSAVLMSEGKMEV